MPNASDETGFSEGREPARGPLRNVYDPSTDDDDLADLIVRRTPFPVTMLATGILWIMAGSTFLALFALLRALQVPFQGNDIWMVVGAFFFIKDGIQMVRGRFRDPHVDGVISVLVGLYFLGQAWFRFEQADGIAFLVVDVFLATLFLAPGVLVLRGRKQYLAWKAEQEID